MMCRHEERGKYFLQMGPRHSAQCKGVLQWTFSVIWSLMIAIAVFRTPSCNAYTLDTSDPVVLRPENNFAKTMFGYTVAIWHVTDSSSWILAGAPNWTHINREGQGALFKCSLNDVSLPCEMVKVDRGQKTCLEKQCEDITNSQRLGATLAVHEDIVLVCAPNWSYKTTNIYGRTTGAPVGKCFYSENNDMTNFNQFSAVYNMKKDNENLYYMWTGFCQAGFSALLLPEKGMVALGSPGCYSWTGDVLVGTPGSNSYMKKGEFYNPSEDFGLSSNKNIRPIDRYLGYSIAGGTFYNKLAVVAGAPKPTSVKSVLNSTISVLERLDDNTLKTLEHFDPTLDEGWYFSYCGYSVAVGDLNGDGLDDIAVGCPNHDDDKGAVLVYYQVKEKDGTFKIRLEDPSHRTGSESGARYGSSVQVLEDIDGDGFPELAVGSPFTSERKGGTGRLYIYCSTAGQDLPKTACQEVGSPRISEGGGLVSLTNFGWSATAHSSASAVVAVSAPASDAVLLFRTHRVVQLRVVVEAPQQLDVSKQCVMDNKREVPCVLITVCLDYTLRNGPKDNTKRDMNIDVNLESTKALTFVDSKTNLRVEFSVQVDKKSCENVLVYDTKNSEEVMEYEITARGSFTPAKNDLVVLDRRNGLDSSTILRKKVDCEDSTYDTCKPSINVSIHQIGDFTLGVDETVKITVSIVVNEDPAYYPKLVLSTAGLTAVSGISVEGAPNLWLENTQTHELTFSLGSVLHDTSVSVSFSLSGSEKFYANLRNGEDFFILTAAVSCSSPVKDTSHANATEKVDIFVEPKILQLSRSGDSNELDLSQWTGRATETLVSKGPKMEHQYEVDNPNNYDLYSASLTIYWPQKHKDGYLLYISNAPAIKRNSEIVGHCVAVAGGGFDEENLNNSNLTDGGMSNTPSSFPGERLGSVDILPLEIKCDLGDMRKEDSVVVKVESYAFFQTFQELKDGMFSPIMSMGVAAPNGAPLRKTFTEEAYLTITTSVVYPQTTFQWWWYLIGAVVGMVVVTIMAGLFYKFGIKNKKKEKAGANNEQEQEMTSVGEGKNGADDDDDAKEPLNQPVAENTTATED